MTPPHSRHDEDLTGWTADQLRQRLVVEQQENARLRAELLRCGEYNDFNAKRLRRLVALLGISAPESDETLLACQGAILSMVARAVEELFKRNGEGA